jgi:transposase
LKGIAADLGISRGALREWVERLASGVTTAGAWEPAAPGSRPDSRAAKTTRLEAELAATQAEARKLATERDIFRQAEKYFRPGDEVVNRFQFVEDHKDA